MHGQGIHYISETAPPKHKNDVEYLNNRAALLDNNITQFLCANGTDRGEVWHTGVGAARMPGHESYATATYSRWPDFWSLVYPVRLLSAI